MPTFEMSGKIVTNLVDKWYVWGGRGAVDGSTAKVGQLLAIFLGLMGLKGEFASRKMSRRNCCNMLRSGMEWSFHESFFILFGILNSWNLEIWRKVSVLAS